MIPVLRWLVAGGALLSILGHGEIAMAYTEATHRILTDQAYFASKVGGPRLWTQFGLDEDANTKVFPGSGWLKKTARELMSDGAEYEDNNVRSLNHFFNPLNGTGLLNGYGQPAPDWALEDKGPLQLWSFRDARETFFNGLTAASPSNRDLNFGITFESLGHVAHLIQDMAQPQHVRNDQHLSIFGVPNPSLFEHMAYSGVQWALLFSDPSEWQIGTESFNAPREFWQTDANGTFTRRGLAEFTNRNFISQGTNFTGSLTAIQPNVNFPRPLAVTIQPADSNAADPRLPPGYPMDFVVTDVTDALVPAQNRKNFRASSVSLFDNDLAQAGKPARFSYTGVNVGAALGFLVPRAIGYSSGMIDYFFRGDIDLVPDDTTMGKYVVLNRSSDAMSGTFALYYDAIDGRRYPVPGAQWNGMAVPARNATTGVAGRSAPIGFQLPVDAKTSGVYMLVFRGDMGNEKQTGNAYGAVTGRMVKAATLEALYIAGVDAQGRGITLRVDENGTQLLSGPAPSGVVKPSSGFDPLLGVANGGTYLRKKPSKLKQVSFPSGPGGLFYRVLAFQALSSSGIRDTSTWNFSNGACCWEAQSPDPAIGKFTFAINPNQSDGNAGWLAYTRTYADVAGNVGTVNGSIPLPPLPGYSSAGLPNLWGYNTPSGGTQSSSRANYKDLVSNGPVVTADGLTVQGLRTAQVTSGDPNGSVSVNIISLRIQLGAAPSVTAVVDETLGYGAQLSERYAGGQEYVSSYPCYTQPLTLKSNSDTSVDRTWHSTIQGRIYVGAFDGLTRSYSIAGGADGHYVENNRLQQWYAGSECDYDAMQDIFGHWDSVQSLDVSFAMLDGAYRVTSSVNSFNDWRRNPIPFNSGHVHCDPPGPHPFYCWGTSIPPVDIQTSQDIRSADQREPVIVFAPYMSAVVYSAIIGDPRTVSTPTLTFRGLDLTGLDFVADASPLGEMFFALTDGTIVFHEPKNGRMPQFVRPSNMVKITAALWL